MEEHFPNYSTDKGLISKICKQLIQLDNKKQTTQLKNGQKTEIGKEDIQMASRHMKRCSTLLITGKMQIKTTMRYHLTLVGITIINKSTNTKCPRACAVKGAFLHCCGNIHWYNPYGKQYESSSEN